MAHVETLSTPRWLADVHTDFSGHSVLHEGVDPPEQVLGGCVLRQVELHAHGQRLAGGHPDCAVVGLEKLGEVRDGLLPGLFPGAVVRPPLADGGEDERPRRHGGGKDVSSGSPRVPAKVTAARQSSAATTLGPSDDAWTVLTRSGNASARISLEPPQSAPRVSARRPMAR